MPDPMHEIIAERRRQILVEGFDAAHDDKHTTEDLIEAALCYEAHAMGWDQARRNDGAPSNWPWEAKWWKPKDKRRDLIRAGALVLAEQDRWARDGMPRQAFPDLILKRIVKALHDLNSSA